MIIQKILHPKKDVCNEWNMYYRGIEAQDHPEEGVRIPAGEMLSLETYFNSFSIGKWVAYTRLDNLYLTLEIKGDVRIRLMHASGHKHLPEVEQARTPEEKEAAVDVAWEEAEGSVTREGNLYTIHFNRFYSKGILYVEITAAENSGGALLLGGAWETDIDVTTLNPVNIAYCICTYKREKELTRNVTKIRDRLIENPDSLLYHKASVFIADNGHTLAEDMFHNDRIRIFRNRNVGGSGGFTRTMLESVVYPRQRGEELPTHIILMDDDIDLDEDILERTAVLLQMLDDAHRQSLVGGAMMELEHRNMQFENGAWWHGVILRSFNHEWDLSMRRCVAANEEINDVNYTGWWYCCIPSEKIRADNLPIPLFIHYDDIEYGQRNSGDGIILMNGICVWHPYGNNKQPIRMNYYDERNILIAMSGSGARASKWDLIDHLSKIITRDVVRYRYEAAEVSFRGIEDFYRGPEYFMRLDPIKLHTRLGKYNYTYTDPEEEDIDISEIRDRPYESYPKFIPEVELLFWLIPSFRDYVVVSEKDIAYGFGARKVYLFDRNRGQGFMVERNAAKTFHALQHYATVAKKILTETDSVMDRWEAKKPQYTSLKFWEKYLGLPSSEKQT